MSLILQRSNCVRSLLTACTLIAPCDLLAHPHAYIDVEMQVKFDSSARISALRQTWLFDGLYSALVTQGLAFKEKDKHDTKRLDAIAQVMMHNLAQYQYFTHVESNQRTIQFGAPVDATTRLKGTRLELAFTLPLTSPVTTDSGSFTYSVYDPSYYIEMLHAEHMGAIQLTSAPAHCSYVLQAPHPDPAQVAKAANLDRTQTAGTGLGIFFAERVTVRCDGQH